MSNDEKDKDSMWWMVINFGPPQLYHGKLRWKV
jgi:hypothetical protein